MIKFEHLIGIPFIHGKTDCYELARCFYRDNWQIELPNFARPNDWWNHGLNLYMENYNEAGFQLIIIPLTQVRIGDAFLMAIRSEVANHCGMYIGGNRILHHPFGLLSTTTHFASRWRDGVVATVRHPAVPEIKPERVPLDIMTLLPAYKRRQLEEAMKNADAATPSSP